MPSATGDPQTIVTALDWLVDRAYLAEDFAAAVAYGRRSSSTASGVFQPRDGRPGGAACRRPRPRPRVLATIHARAASGCDRHRRAARALAAREGRIREALDLTARRCPAIATRACVSTSP